MDIVSLIQGMPDYIGANGVNKNEIVDCEEALGIVFASDYKQYLENIGLACFDGRELTGICDSKRLNVVSVTLEEHIKNPTVTNNWYVIEQTGFDGIVIWQDSSGTVYQVAENGTVQITYKSLSDYVLNSF